jgi:prevent-host-death family protein
MRTVNIHAAKTHLSRLVEDAAAGEEIIIAKSGKPVARLCPLVRPSGKRKLGALEGKLRIPDDFDAPLPDEVLDLFEDVEKFSSGKRN